MENGKGGGGRVVVKWEEGGLGGEVLKLEFAEAGGGGRVDA